MQALCDDIKQMDKDCVVMLLECIIAARDCLVNGIRVTMMAFLSVILVVERNVHVDMFSFEHSNDLLEFP